MVKTAEDRVVVAEGKGYVIHVESLSSSFYDFEDDFAHIYETFRLGAKPGKRVVIIGAGNVGCDVATEAHRLGAASVTLIDIQEPASFGAEREAAEAVGAQFRWPCFTKAIIQEGVELTDGEVLPADTVVVSIGVRISTSCSGSTFMTSYTINDVISSTSSRPTPSCASRSAPAPRPPKARSRPTTPPPSPPARSGDSTSNVRRATGVRAAPRASRSRSGSPTRTT